MPQEFSYETFMTRVHANELDEQIEENERYKDDVETEILGLIMMDPSKVRNARRKKKGENDDEDYGWMNNVQYLTHLWKELKEQWEESHARIVRCNDAKWAVERKTRNVDVCPDCLVELNTERIKPLEFGLVCPKCGKQYINDYSAPYEENKDKPKSMVITINTYEDGDC